MNRPHSRAAPAKFGLLRELRSRSPLDQLDELGRLVVRYRPLRLMVSLGNGRSAVDGVWSAVSGDTPWLFGSAQTARLRPVIVTTMNDTSTHYGVMPTVQKYGRHCYTSYGSDLSSSYKPSSSNDDAAS